MKLTKGTLKVIVQDPYAIVENAERARNGGKIFMPPFHIYEYDRDTKSLDRHNAFDFQTAGLKPRYAITKFPYDWAPTALKDFRVWYETRNEVELVTHYSPEE